MLFSSTNNNFKVEKEKKMLFGFLGFFFFLFFK